MRDVTNPIYFDRLIAPFQDAPPLLGTNDSNVMTLVASPLCRARPHACHSKLQFDQFKNRDTIHLQSIPCHIQEIFDNH